MTNKKTNTIIFFLIIIFSLTSCSISKRKLQTSEPSYKHIELNEFLKAKHIIPSVKNWILMGGKVEFGQEKFKIGIFDKNNNGLFDDYGIDILFVTQYNSKFTQYTPIISSSVCLLKQENLINVDDIFYKVGVGRDKKSIKIWKFDNNGNGKTNTDLVYTSKVPDIAIEDLDYNQYNFREFVKGEKIRLLFWATYCYPCINHMHALKAKNKETEDYRTILILGDEDVNTAKTILKEQGFNWPCIKSTSWINKIFNQNGYPYEVFIDSTGTIHYEY